VDKIQRPGGTSFRNNEARESAPKQVFYRVFPDTRNATRQCHELSPRLAVEPISNKFFCRPISTDGIRFPRWNATRKRPGALQNLPSLVTYQFWRRRTGPNSRNQRSQWIYIDPYSTVPEPIIGSRTRKGRLARCRNEQTISGAILAGKGWTECLPNVPKIVRLFFRTILFSQPGLHCIKN
jgi:hypothetical protein